MEDTVKIHNEAVIKAMGPMLRKGVPLQLRVAHMPWGGHVLGSISELGLVAQEAIAAELDSEIGPLLAEEISSGKYPAYDADPDYAASVLFGICTGMAVGVAAGVPREFYGELVGMLCEISSGGLAKDAYYCNMRRLGLAA